MTPSSQIVSCSSACATEPMWPHQSHTDLERASLMVATQGMLTSAAPT
jgi:hypothetical protein